MGRQPPSRVRNDEAGFPVQAEPIPDELYDLLQSPSLFGRMLLIAAFRSASTGRYEAGPAVRSFTPELHDALRELHLEIFHSWLTLSLERQHADIKIYLNLGEVSGRSAKVKQLLAQGEKSIPADVLEPEQQLFLQDLKVVQALLSYDQ